MNESVVETDRQTTGDSTTRRMRFAYWILKATDTHSEDVILIVFPLQQWLHIVHCVSLLLLSADHTNKLALSKSADSQYL